MCICLRSLVYCWTNILLNRLELFINNNTGIRVKENKGRVCLSPSLIITIFHLHLTLRTCSLVVTVCAAAPLAVLFNVVLTEGHASFVSYLICIGLLLVIINL